MIARAQITELATTTWVITHVTARWDSRDKTVKVGLLLVSVCLTTGTIDLVALYIDFFNAANKRRKLENTTVTFV